MNDTINWKLQNMITRYKCFTVSEKKTFCNVLADYIHNNPAFKGREPNSEIVIRNMKLFYGMVFLEPNYYKGFKLEYYYKICSYPWELMMQSEEEKIVNLRIETVESYEYIKEYIKPIHRKLITEDLN